MTPLCMVKGEVCCRYGGGNNQIHVKESRLKPDQERMSVEREKEERGKQAKRDPGVKLNKDQRKHTT